MSAPDNALPMISGYDNGGFLIHGDFRAGGILIRNGKDSGFDILPWKHPATADETGIDDFAPLLARRPDLILFGVGAEMLHGFERLRVIVSNEAGIGLEVQSTPAICRTWNLLISEGRRVALAAMPAPKK